VRRLSARSRVLWAAAGLVVAVAGLGAGLWVGADRAPARQPAAHRALAPAASRPGSAGLGSFPEPSAAPMGWKQLPAARVAFQPVELVIERIGVQAAVESKGVDSHNVMEAPDQPLDVAWYRFTAQPGSGSNAVFSGHRDYSGVGPAVFWRLSDLRPGDVVDVVSAEASEARYRVTRTTSYPVASIPMASILAPSRQDEITIMTCAGAFHQAGGYDHRLVVEGTRIA
jgi:sortase family protein